MVDSRIMSAEKRKEGSQKGPQNHNEQPRRLALELPMPVPGVTEKIFVDLLANRAKFVREELAHMGKENKDLRDWLVQDCLMSATRDVSLDWALMYYAIYSRSARKTVAAMPEVSEASIRSKFEERSTLIQSLEEDEAGAYLIKESERKRDEIYSRDTNRSYELFVFWSRAHIFGFTNRMHRIYTAQRIDLNLVPIMPDETLDSLYELANLLHNQVDANNLREQFQKE